MFGPTQIGHFGATFAKASVTYTKMKQKILFVCLGNICRSPCAHGIFQFLDKNNQFEIESAGTSAYHIGEEMDSRMQAEMVNQGIPFSHKARQFLPSDLDTYDNIICMDEKNYMSVLMHTDTEEQKDKIHMLREFDPKGRGNVPDPYYENNFEDVFQTIKRSCEKLYEELSKNH